MIKVSWVQTLAITSLLSFLVPAPVNAEDAPVRWLAQAGADFGGEKLGSVSFTNGDSADVRANNGILLAVGADIANGVNSPFRTQVFVGYKFGGPSADNDDITWSALPIDILEFYHFSSVKLGVGIDYQLNPKLDVDIPGTKFVSNFENALGYVAQVGWEPSQHYSFDLRYTAISYQLSGASNVKVDGNVAGIYAAYKF